MALTSSVFRVSTCVVKFVYSLIVFSRVLSFAILFPTELSDERVDGPRSVSIEIKERLSNFQHGRSTSYYFDGITLFETYLLNFIQVT